jgi:hypothetical protein
MVECQEEGHAFGVQRPVYFISEVLSESNVCYPTIQKILYGILITFRKLHHYFDSYNILVVTDFLLADILHNWDATRRISKWAVERGVLTLDFKPRTAIKLQALVEFNGRMARKPSESPCQALGHVLRWLTQAR